MGRRIRLRRREKRISQIDLARHLGSARLQQIAKMLDVDIPFFYDVDGKEPAVESLLFLNNVFSLQLLRAFTAVKNQAVQRQLVILVETIATSQR